jgi:hypothetical protein
MHPSQPGSYKGFEIHPLVFARKRQPYAANAGWQDGYDVGVRICRPEALAGSTGSRVFRIVRESPFEQMGDARRFALRHGEQVIDGTVPGESVTDL